MKNRNRQRFLCVILIIFIVSGCSSTNASGAPAAVEDYYQALVEKDQNKMISLSCALWESDTRLMFGSFEAVDLTLEDLSCQVDAMDGENTLVSCTGSLIASYGAEDLVIDIAERNIIVVEEGGEWRICGYQGE